jgi:hypothetical protein
MFDIHKKKTCKQRMLINCIQPRQNRWASRPMSQRDIFEVDGVEWLMNIIKNEIYMCIYIYPASLRLTYCTVHSISSHVTGFERKSATFALGWWPDSWTSCALRIALTATWQQAYCASSCTCATYLLLRDVAGRKPSSYGLKPMKNPYRVTLFLKKKIVCGFS